MTRAQSHRKIIRDSLKFPEKNNGNFENTEKKTEFHNFPSSFQEENKNNLKCCRDLLAQKPSSLQLFSRVQSKMSQDVNRLSGSLLKKRNSELALRESTKGWHWKNEPWLQLVTTIKIINVQSSFNTISLNFRSKCLCYRQRSSGRWFSSWNWCSLLLWHWNGIRN